MKILHINSMREFYGAEKIYRYIFDKLGGEKINIEDYIFKNNYLRLINKLIFSFSLYFKIKNTIKTYNPEVILIHGIDLSPFSVLLAIKGHKNIVQIVHDATQAGCPSAWTIYRKNYGKCDVKMKYGKCAKNCAYDKSKIGFFVYYFWLKLFLFLKKKVVRKYISPSVALKDILINNDFRNTVVLGNNIEFKDINKEYEKENIFLYVGSIDKRKGIDKLIEAIDELNFLKKDWKFIIIGDGEILQELKNRYTNTFYQFLGKKDNNEVLQYCKKSKILFIPSILFESFGLVALEGILYNNVVLGNNIGGIPEIITENNTFSILNKKNIQEKLIDVLNNFDFYYQNSQKQKEIFLEKNKTYFDNLIEIINN